MSTNAQVSVAQGADVIVMGDGNGNLRRHGSQIGTAVHHFGTAAPAGTLVCSGQSLLRAEYPDLFNVIGTTWGIGDGSSTFNLPDIRGRAMFGVDAMGGTLRLESSGLGGSVFAVDLPLRPVAEERAEAVGPVAPALAGRTVMIVADSPFEAHFVAEHLEAAGARARAATRLHHKCPTSSPPGGSMGARLPKAHWSLTDRPPQAAARRLGQEVEEAGDALDAALVELEAAGGIVDDVLNQDDPFVERQPLVDDLQDPIVRALGFFHHRLKQDDAAGRVVD
jgi:microcystin-dependent protein